MKRMRKINKTKRLAKVEAPAPKVFKRKPVPKERPKTGPIPKVSAKFKWKGKKDKRLFDLIRVHPDDMPAGFPTLSRHVPPFTDYMVNPALGRTQQLITAMPDGVNVAWSTCAICLNHPDRCVCPAGITPPRSIEAIYVKTLMAMDGLDVSGPMNAQSHEVTSRGIYWYKGKETGRTLGPPVRPRTPATRPEPPARAARPAERPSAPRKRLRKTSGPAPEVNLQKIDAAAASKSEELLADVERQLSDSKPTKKMKKVRK